MSFFKNFFGKKEEKPDEKLNEDISSAEVAELLLNVVPRIGIAHSDNIHKNETSRSIGGSQTSFSINLPEDQQPVVKKLYADLMLTFAVDKGAVFELVQKKILKSAKGKEIGVNEDVLFKFSLDNLIERVNDKIKLNGDPDYIMMVTAGGNFEASLILIENFWKKIHEILNGNAIVAIPAKDLLFIAKENNQEAIEKLKEMIQDFHSSPNSQGLLSKALYLKKRDKNELSIYETAL